MSSTPQLTLRQKPHHSNGNASPQHDLGHRRQATADLQALSRLEWSAMCDLPWCWEAGMYVMEHGKAPTDLLQ
jgi:hypothetical protein